MKRAGKQRPGRLQTCAVSPRNLQFSPGRGGWPPLRPWLFVPFTMDRLGSLLWEVKPQPGFGNEGLGLCQGFSSFSSHQNHLEGMLRAGSWAPSPVFPGQQSWGGGPIPRVSSKLPGGAPAASPLTTPWAAPSPLYLPRVQMSVGPSAFP